MRVRDIGLGLIVALLLILALQTLDRFGSAQALMIVLVAPGMILSAPILWIVQPEDYFTAEGYKVIVAFVFWWILFTLLARRAGRARS